MGNGIQYATDVTTYPTLSNLVSVTAIKVITNDTVKVGDEDALSLNYEDLAVHLFVHLIKHLADKGCGIRHFCDLVVLLESKEDEINWDSFWEKINEYKLEKSTKIVFYICTEYLGWLEL